MPQKKGEAGIKPKDISTREMIGCIDGRPAIFVLKFNPESNQYEIYLNTEELKGLNYVQVLGAAFGFVAVAEVKFKLNMKQAFDLVEKALEEAGFKPSFHADTHDKNHRDLTNKLQGLYKRILKTKNEKEKKSRTEEFVQIILSNLEGCGFAVHQWGKNAPLYIKEAVRRGWLIQVLSGEHEESKGGAHLNHKIKGRSISVIEANENDEPTFNQDQWFAFAVLMKMLEVARQEGYSAAGNFVEDSLKWLEETFATVVVALGGVENSSQIQHHD